MRRWESVLRPAFLCLVGVSAAASVLAYWLHRPWLTFAAGLLIGGTIAFVVVSRGLPPDHIAHWGEGAEGERRTAAALEPLEAEGWTVIHDEEKQRGGNVDHFLAGPPGVFLLDTKAYRGRLSVEDGALVRRFVDGDVKRENGLGRWLRGDAAAAAEDASRTAGFRPWVQPVVVLWGDFEQGLVVADGVVYVHGERLVDWLRALPARRVELTLAAT